MSLLRGAPERAIEPRADEDLMPPLKPVDGLVVRKLPCRWKPMLLWLVVRPYKGAVVWPFYF